jgi:membrane associated rhomboid family serine protease
MCRNCGALVGANETSCSLCDAPRDSTVAVQPQTAPQVYDHEAMRFARAILSRPYIFTIVFLVANVFVFMLMWSSSGLNSATLWEPPQSVLIAYGAKLNSLIKGQHEWWRFVTPVFIHIGLAHLLINMYGLWMIGPYVERLYGSAKFVVLWVMTGVAGVVASYLSLRPEMAVGAVGRFLFRAEDGPAAGASGALFGLVGVLFVFGIKFRRELPEGFKRAFGTGLLPIILLNLFIGYIGRGFIDNAAHLGGLLSGALFALVINYKRPDERAGVAVVWHILQVAALALVAVSFVMIARHFPKQLPKSDESAATSDSSPSAEALAFAANLDVVNEGRSTFLNSLKKNDASRIDATVQALDQAPHLDDETNALRNDLKSLLTNANSFISASSSTGPPAKARVIDENKLGRDFQAWKEKYDNWTKTESQRYGVKLIKQAPPKETSSSDK